MLHIFRDFVDSSVPFQVNSDFFSHFIIFHLLPLLFRSSVSSLPQQQPPSRPAELRTRQRIYVNGSDNDSRPTSALSTSSGVSRTTTAAHHAVSFFLVHTNARIVTWSTKVEK